MTDSTITSLSAEAPFRVIIIGAGVTGLTLAHSLEKSNIDYLVLDKGVVAPSFGTTITMQPHGCRILHQIGVLDAVLAQCSTMGGAHCRTPSGKSFAHNDFFGVVRKNAGYDTRTLDRKAFLQTLYDHLPDKSKVIERARVETVVEKDSLVRVELADGTEHTGDLVVGADGVHSKIREIMWEKANKIIPGFISAEEKRTMTTTYNAIVAACPPVPGLGEHDMEVISNDKFSFLLLCQPDWISFIVHCKLPEDQQCRWPNRKKYTEEDMEALAAKIASYPVNDTVVFGELWKRRTKAQLISLEEGVLNHWFFGRTVLAGDSIHKVTPNSALGGCTAMESAVSIANAIHDALAKHPNKKPTDFEIRDAMQHYQDSRLARVKEIVKVGGDLTRLQAYDGWMAYLTQRWLTPILGMDFLAKNIAELCSGAPKLKYVPFDEQRGLLGWKDTLAASKGTKQGGREAIWDEDFEKIFPRLLGGLIAFAAMVWWVILKDAKYAVPGFAVVEKPMEVHANSTLALLLS